MPTAAPPVAEKPRTRALANEDWVAVWIAAAIIALVIVGVRPDVPQFGWGRTADLTATVFAPANVWRWLQLGVLILVPAAVGARLMGARLVPFMVGFAVLYGTGVCLADPGRLCGLDRHRTRIRESTHLSIGLLLGHTTPLGRRFAEAVRTEYYIKIGLVILGTRVLFPQLVDARPARGRSGASGGAQCLDVLLLAGEAFPCGTTSWRR